MQNTLQFVALDLETTGLDPKTDAIIEIAAIKFSLVFDGEKITIQNPEERNMLINPWIPLPDEVTMITGITQKMLEWRVRWEEIREKVDEFIGKNSIILGHNVFFDVTMLETHGINLRSNRGYFWTFWDFVAKIGESKSRFFGRFL